MTLHDKLIDAVEANNIPEVLQLIKEGADVHFYNEYPLRTAWANWDYDLAKVLIENGAIFNDGNFLVRWAASKDRLDFIKLFMENAKNINTKEDYGISKAASLGYLDVVKYFLIETHQDSNIILNSSNKDKIHPSILPWLEQYHASKELNDKLSGILPVSQNKQPTIKI